MTYITLDVRRLARSETPHTPYPLYWSPRTYGTSFGLAGPGG